jgi:hypothetical protein
MATIEWNPGAAKPADAAEIETEIERIARDAVVRISRDGERFRVRALLPAALCMRGATMAERDVSARVADVLADFGLPATV